MLHCIIYAGILLDIIALMIPMRVTLIMLCASSSVRRRYVQSIMWPCAVLLLTIVYDAQWLHFILAVMSALCVIPVALRRIIVKRRIMPIEPCDINAEF